MNELVLPGWAKEWVDSNADLGGHRWVALLRRSTASWENALKFPVGCVVREVSAHNFGVVIGYDQNVGAVLVADRPEPTLCPVRRVKPECIEVAAYHKWSTPEIVARQLFGGSG